MRSFVRIFKINSKEFAAFVVAALKFSVHFLPPQSPRKLRPLTTAPLTAPHFSFVAFPESHDRVKKLIFPSPLSFIFTTAGVLFQFTASFVPCSYVR